MAGTRRRARFPFPRTRILQTADELAEFARCFERASGIAVDAAYLARSQVRGFFDRTGDMYSGYVLNTRQPFRYFSRWFVTPAHLAVPHMPDLDTCAEITCIWERPEVSTLQKTFAGLCIVYDCWRSGKRYFLGGSFHAAVMRVHKLSLPHELFTIAFTDPVTGQPGEHFFYYGTAADIALSIPRLFVKKVRKQLRKRKAPAPTHHVRPPAD